jgi:hypothetical protein
MNNARLRAIGDAVKRGLWIAVPFIGDAKAVRQLLGKRWIENETLGVRLLIDTDIYVAEVTDVVEDAEYYTDARFKWRPDCICRMANRQLLIRSDARHHPNGDLLKRDVGAFPECRRARVLLSANSRYFGIKGECSYREAYPRVTELLRAMIQGHRVNHGLDDDLRNLQREIWGRFRHMKIGEPTRRTSSSERTVACQRQIGCYS